MRYRCALLLALAIIIIVGCLSPTAQSRPWDLESYNFCYTANLTGIENDASGVTFSEESNTLWVITRRPRVMVEYNLQGEMLRNLTHVGFRDPEGIVWMNDFTFGIVEEGRGEGWALSIVEAWPGLDRVNIVQRMNLSTIGQQSSGLGLEGLAWNRFESVFYATQEKRPKVIWRIDLQGNATEVLNLDLSSNLHGIPRSLARGDMAGAYYRAGDRGLYVLSEDVGAVHWVGFDGTVRQDIKTDVLGRMPEGLTFTPDGDLMIVTGEPNELWVYTSTGDCYWSPFRSRSKYLQGSSEAAAYSESSSA